MIPILGQINTNRTLLFLLVLVGMVQLGAAQNTDSLTIIAQLEEWKESPSDSAKIDGLLQLRADCQKITNLHLEAEVLYLLGITYYRSREYDQSLETFQQSLTACRSSHPKDAYLETKILSNCGLAAGQTGREREGRQWLETAIELRTKLVGSEDGKMVGLYLNAGNAHLIGQNLPQAKAYYEKGIHIREGIYGVGHRRLWALYNNLAIVYNELGQYPDARKYVNKVIEGLAQEEEPDAGQASGAYTTLANIYELEGDFSQAISWHQNALKLRLEAYGPDDEEVANSYYSLAVSQKKTKQYEKALSLVRQAIAILKQLPAKNELEYLECELLEANCLEGLGERVAAGKKLKEVVRKIEGIDDESAFFVLGSAYISLGDHYRERKMYTEASTVITKAQALFQQLLGNENIWTAEASYQLGVIAYRQQNYALARTHLEETLEYLRFDSQQPDFTACLNVELVQEPLVLLGEIALLQGRSTKGFQLLHQYQEINDWLRSNYLGSLSKDLLVTGEIEVAELVLEAVFAKEEPLETSELMLAIETIQRTKAARLFEELQKNKALETLLPTDWAEEGRTLQAAVNYYRTQLSELYAAKTPANDIELLEINEAYLQATRKLEQFVAKTQENYPAYYQTRYQPRTLKPAAIQQQLLPDSTGLLEFFVGNEAIYQSLILKDTLLLRRITPDFDLSAATTQFLYGINAYYINENPLDDLYDEALEKYLEQGENLYRSLLYPLRNHLPPRLVIVPDGELNRLPFSALLTGTPNDFNEFSSYPYLLKKHEISYAYAAAVWEQMSSTNFQFPHRDSMLVVAPFESVPLTKGYPTQSYDPLLSTPAGIDFLQTHFSTNVLVNEKATLGRVTDLIARYPLVHFMTHASAKSKENASSVLSLFRDTEDVEAGKLYSKAIYHLPLSNELIVLSACETGDGILVPGEGVLSLGRSFAYAGAKSIVNSLWSIDDYSTTTVMKLFYQQLNKTGKATALHRAKIDHLAQAASGQLAHPYFWSGLVFYGDLKAY